MQWWLQTWVIAQGGTERCYRLWGFQWGQQSWYKYSVILLGAKPFIFRVWKVGINTIIFARQIRTVWVNPLTKHGAYLQTVAYSKCTPQITGWVGLVKRGCAQSTAVCTVRLGRNAPKSPNLYNYRFTARNKIHQEPSFFIWWTPPTAPILQKSRWFDSMAAEGTVPRAKRGRSPLQEWRGSGQRLPSSLGRGTRPTPRAVPAPRWAHAHPHTHLRGWTPASDWHYTPIPPTETPLAPRNDCGVCFLFGLRDNYVPSNLSENSGMGLSILSMLQWLYPVRMQTVYTFFFFFFFPILNKAAIYSILSLEISGSRYQESLQQNMSSKYIIWSSHSIEASLSFAGDEASELGYAYPSFLLRKTLLTWYFLQHHCF